MGERKVINNDLIQLGSRATGGLDNGMRGKFGANLQEQFVSIPDHMK